MGGSSSTPAVASPAPRQYTSNILGALQLSNSYPNMMLGLAPTVRTVDVRGLQDMTRQEALLNALASKEVEGRVSPDTLAVREALPGQIRQDLEGGPSSKLSNMWLTQGLNDVIATGAMTNSGFARSALADATRKDYYDNRTAQQAKAAALLQANPAPVAGLDPGQLAGVVQGTKNANADATDAWRNAVALSGQQNAQSAQANLLNAMQQNAQRWGVYNNDLATASNAQRASKGSFWGNTLSGAATGASAGSMVGPYGTVIGGVLGAVGGALASR